jgi:hypothetical protein
MALIDGMLRELEERALTTRRVLERVPDDRLGWRPHQVGRTLGELARHVAIVPGGVAQLIASPSPARAPQSGPDRSPASSSELMPALDQSSATAKQVLGAGHVLDASKMLWIEASSRALYSAFDCRADSPSTSAREKLATTP